MQLLATKFAQISTAIDATNAQIATLQAKLSELQEHQQQLLSVEQACQSAIAQVGTALSMLNHVDPTEIATFKAAVDAQFGTDAIAFLEPATPAPSETVEPKPIAPTAPETTPTTAADPVIDVEVAPVANTPTVPTPTTTAADIEEMLNKMSIQSIRKLAAAKGVDAKGTRVAIAGRLKAIATQVEIWDAS